MHSVSETSCSKSPTFHVCAVISARNVFACSVAEICPINLLPYPLLFRHGLCLNRKCHALVDVALPSLSSRAPECPLAHTLVGRGVVYTMLTCESRETHYISELPIHIRKSESILHRHSIIHSSFATSYSHMNVDV